MDQPPNLTDDDEDEEDGAPSAPAARRSPLGCGIAAGLFFAAMVAPTFAAEFMSGGCAPWDEACVPGAPWWSGIEGPSFVAASALLFGIAAGRMVKRRSAPGAPRRPPLWAAFAALTLFGMTVAGLVGSVVAALLG